MVLIVLRVSLKLWMNVGTTEFMMLEPMCGYFPMPESNNEKGSRKAPFSFINSGLQEITMALILDMGPDGKGGEILHPMLMNKWRLPSSSISRQKGLPISCQIV